MVMMLVVSYVLMLVISCGDVGDDVGGELCVDIVGELC